MFKIEKLIMESKIKNHLKNYKSALTCSFIFGLLLGSIPFIYKSRENFRVKKLIEEQRKIEIQEKEKKCKQNDSDYKKFLSLGFPKTAIEKFKICMEEQ